MAPDLQTGGVTDDAVLGGRLVLRQPKRGHRVGHDAVLLAAATGGRAGEHVVDLGAGVGAAGLALAARVAGLTVTLVEIDPGLAELAAGNILRNAFDGRATVIAGDVEDVAALDRAGLRLASVDRVLMNPPFNDLSRQNASPDPRRRLAHAADAGLLTRWVASAAALLRENGVLTLIWRADGLGEVLPALRPAFGGVAVLPVSPRPGAAPVRVLLRAVKGGSGAMRDYPALILNDATGKPSAAAEAVLRGAEPLAMAAS